jgi:hypothetical protein
MSAAMAATTVEQYLASLPADRRAALEQVRRTVNANLPAGYEEGIEFGMICWYVPLSRYPDTYNKRPLGIAALASQKQYMALYLNGVYGDPKLASWFAKAFAAAGKKLDMGKSCVRFKSIDALPLDVIGETIAKVPVDTYIAGYEKARGKPAKTARAPKPKPRANPKATTRRARR